MASLKPLFMLDPDIVFLNHGSFGACPKAVFKAYQAWQRRLENQPVQFIQHDLPGLEKEARRTLGIYLHTAPENLAFVTNATYGVNIISRSLDLHPGDEVLTTDQEYGACDKAWEFACRKTSASYIHHPVSLPVHSMAEVADEIWQGVTPRTKVIYLSHITSPTALRLPVEEICRRARSRGILTLVDGAHAPGQLSLEMEAIGADFYTGNCHKWMLCPKGVGFLFARREVQHLVKPLVVSWGYEPDKIGRDDYLMFEYLYWTGTRDPSAYLTVPAAIAFMEKYHWDTVRQQCHALLQQAVTRICDLTSMVPLFPLDSDFYSQMGIAPLPTLKDVADFSDRLYRQRRIVLPITQFHERCFARISVQGYNSQTDIDKLLDVLALLLPEYANQPFDG